MGHEPQRFPKKKRNGKKPAPVTQPNFTLVGESYRTPTEMLDLLRYSEVERCGKSRWRVCARFDEWVHGGGDHVVELINTGRLICDCRQAFGQRECHHVVAVRQFGRIAPTRIDDRQIRIFPELEGAVQVDDRRQRGAHRG